MHTTKGDWFQTLGNKIQSVSNAIHQKTLRGDANFIVVSPETATILESILDMLQVLMTLTQINLRWVFRKSGAINNRYTVYKPIYVRK